MRRHRPRPIAPSLRHAPSALRLGGRRRPRTGRWLGLTAALLVTTAAVAAPGGVREAWTPGAEPGPSAVAPAPSAGVREAEAAARLAEPLRPDAAVAIPQLPQRADLAATPVIGEIGGASLHLPAAEPVVVGFHEAAVATARELHPVGVLGDDRNATRTQLPADVDDGASYLVLSSRGRAAAPTSALDVVLREDEPVAASVTGTVVDVRRYLLYGTHRDVRIEIVPADRPDLRVVAIHVRGPRVAVGDEVVGGVTPIANSVRRFSFSSQIDRETEPDRLGHVHLEVQPRDAPRPGDADAR